MINKNKNKINLYIDVDNTIYPTNEAMCYMYERLTGLKPKTYFTKEWNMKDCYDNVDKNIVHKLFDEDDFYYTMNVYDGCKEALLELCCLYNIHFVSVGTIKNLENKKKWLQEQFPYVPTENLILLNQVGKVDNVDKSMCKGGVIIDDNLKALETSKCDYKIMYRPKGCKDLAWQKGYKELLLEGNINWVCDGWSDVVIALYLHTYN